MADIIDPNVPEVATRPRGVSSRPRASQGNRAMRRHAAKLTGMKAPRGIQDDPKKVVKLTHVEKKVPCSNKGCSKPRQNGSSRCKDCSDSYGQNKNRGKIVA